MLRTVLLVVLPLVLPTLIYLAYSRVERRRAEAEGSGQPVPWWVGAPWPWLAGGGVLLMGVVLVACSLSGGSQPGEIYHPARMIDGKLVGGETDRPASQNR
jgi:hypothetical protein